MRSEEAAVEHTVALSLHVVADDGQAIHTNNVPWTVGATNCVTLTLLRNPCVVAGTLQDDEDKPLAGAIVHLAQWCRMRLDGNGQAAARFPSGTYRNGVLVHMNTEYVVEPFTATPQTRSLTLTARPLGAEEAAQRKRRFPWFTPAEAADSGAR
ncbi:hypothetical protein GX586_01045 [bacterium]|nr:hypothetical protein [bacterium]